MSDLAGKFDSFNETELKKLWPILASLPPNLSSGAIYSEVNDRYRVVLNKRMEFDRKVDSLKAPILSVLRDFSEEFQLDTYTDYESLDDVFEDIADRALRAVNLYPDASELD